jgi:hypothetical protein
MRLLGREGNRPSGSMAPTPVRGRRAAGATLLPKQSVDLLSQASSESSADEPLEVVRVVARDFPQRPAGVPSEVEDCPGRVAGGWTGVACVGLGGPGLFWPRRSRTARRCLSSGRLRGVGHRPCGIVGGAPDRVTQDVPGVVDRDHPARVAAHIRVVFPGEDAICGPDDFGLGARVNLEDFVVIRHGGEPTSSPRVIRARRDTAARGARRQKKGPALRPVPSSERCGCVRLRWPSRPASERCSSR